MGSDLSGDHAVIEVRTYRAREGQRERLMSLMRERAFAVQRKLCILMWRAFYQGPEWAQELEEQLMPLLASYASVPVDDQDRLWRQWPGQA